ncbi:MULTISPECIES: Gfo/Idh/MocA family protein [unclassified Rathayibacter]|uniref:Gfo/Idh/MocA family protein n=1 Tax=unclassified Rathayibacter TaxID=2609250 RepID=UPI000F4B39AC|nr:MULTISPECIES: Gfo/Idh/MocA family oxidoreductase [unclassified Rathayibacter]ROP48764.1 putative dehydrogenase [Rathayibacter sp. PhB186]ROS49913.1 putative dehydrogenase [Rathayibacter sp. PhB185]
MTFTLGIVGAGQFSRHFADLFHRHPGVGAITVTDVLDGRAETLVESEGLAGTHESFEAILADPAVDAVALFTQRWTHGPLVARALRAGKHVYSAVPMASDADEIAEIIELVSATGLTYMMGETSQYNPATVFARRKHEEGAFGRVFYLEGDYLHDMDHGFYDAYRYSGGDDWKSTASYPPMWYPTHSIGGVLGAVPMHATSVSCTGMRDHLDDGVFDTDVSMFGNDFSNMTALFELDGGGSMRINEFRRVGYPSFLRESRFRFFGTTGVFEQLVQTSVWQTGEGVEDVTEQLATTATMADDDPRLENVSPALRAAFVSGHAPVHEEEAARLPGELEGAPNGHEGSHHFLVDDFVRAVSTGTLPTVNAWVAARYTLPGLVAMESARQNGARLPIPDHGDAPVAVGEPLPASARV